MLIRLMIAGLSIYGFVLSRHSSQTIARLARRAQAGDQGARAHFTQSRWAHLLGPRNSDLGMVFYSVTALATLTGLIRRPLILTGLRLMSGAGVFLSAVLLWSLLARLHQRCTICLQAHGINLALFLLLLKARPRGTHKPGV